MRCRDVPAGASDLSQTGGSYDGNDGPIKEECRKTRRKRKMCVSGRLHLDWADGGIRATDAPNRYVPTSNIAENAGERSTECRDRIRQTPRTGDNNCDVGTYRQVRPTFPKRADLMTGTTVPIKEECPKTRRKRKMCVSGRLYL